MSRRLFILSLLFFSSSISAKELQDYFANIDTWRAHFTQTVVNREQRDSISSSGEIYLQRPNKLRLEYQQPYIQTYVADGKKLWLYDEDLEQVTVKPQDDSLNQTPVMILSQPEKLSASYEIVLEKAEGERASYRLTPRDQESGFERIYMIFDKGRLREMDLYDSFGQRTQLQFQQVRHNPAIAAELFTFVPPEGVDVIGE